jgi:hypothetical protein
MPWGRGPAGVRAIGLVLATAIAVGALWPAGAQGQRRARVGQPAPEITGVSWINSEPLSVAGLRGRVVFVEFWTYG